MLLQASSVVAARVATSNKPKIRAVKLLGGHLISGGPSVATGNSACIKGLPATLCWSCFRSTCTFSQQTRATLWAEFLRSVILVLSIHEMFLSSLVPFIWLQRCLSLSCACRPSTCGARGPIHHLLGEHPLPHSANKLSDPCRLACVCVMLLFMYRVVPLVPAVTAAVRATVEEHPAREASAVEVAVTRCALVL